MRLTGGCLCEGVRYAVEADGAVVDVCHCRTCRRAGGAAMVAWMQVAVGTFALTAGQPSGFASSPGSMRWHCPVCGAQTHMTDGAGRSVGVTVGTLDDAEAVRPAGHGFDASRPSWLVLCDGLPRFDGPPPWDAADAPGEPEEP